VTETRAIHAQADITKDSTDKRLILSHIIGPEFILEIKEPLEDMRELIRV
jgi:hypothetical protein